MPYNKDRTLFNGHKIFIKDGYECIDDGHFRYVHRLIMEEYLGRPLLTSEEIHHKDENKRHNDPSNFDIKSKADHANYHSDGSYFPSQTGSLNTQARLKEYQVLEIISKVHQENDIQKVADEYGVHYVTVWDIWKGRTWKHMER